MVAHHGNNVEGKTNATMVAYEIKIPTTQIESSMVSHKNIITTEAVEQMQKMENDDVFEREHFDGDEDFKNVEEDFPDENNLYSSEDEWEYKPNNEKEIDYSKQAKTIKKQKKLKAKDIEKKEKQLMEEIIQNNKEDIEEMHAQETSELKPQNLVFPREIKLSNDWLDNGKLQDIKIKNNELTLDLCNIKP